MDDDTYEAPDRHCGDPVRHEPHFHGEDRNQGIGTSRCDGEARRVRTLALGPHDLYRLDHACIPIMEAFGGNVPYLVGSVFHRRDFRDVDVRLILSDGEHVDLFAERPGLLALLNCALSEQLSRASGLPVDFQVQGLTEANQHKGFRSALGVTPIQRIQDAWRASEEAMGDA